ncbi:MAG: nitroreductase family protein [Clostridia bacterium]|nr:nitroreductase family protein [Clostridia bacterium]
MEYKDLVQERYSCKSYDPDKEIEEDKLRYILNCGRLAPTAKNLQEQHIYVARSKEALQKVDQITPCRYGAPVVLIIAFDSSSVFTYPGGKRDSGIEDAAIVATHMMLAAKDCGIDSCMINKLDPDEAACILSLPANEKILMLMDLGYASASAKPLPNHTSRKGLADTVSCI